MLCARGGLAPALDGLGYNDGNKKMGRDIS